MPASDADTFLIDGEWISDKERMRSSVVNGSL
jgi:hypothetical protein